jgi:hypothetical protein
LSNDAGSVAVRAILFVPEMMPVGETIETTGGVLVIVNVILVDEIFPILSETVTGIVYRPSLVIPSD